MEPQESSTHKGVHSTFTNDDSEDTEVSQLRTRFKKLHINSMVNQIEDLFSSFHKDAGNELVNRYLEKLDQFYRDVPEENCSRAVHYWHLFLGGIFNLEKLATELSFAGDKHLKDLAVNLAFWRKYPRFCDKPGLTPMVMLQAIEAKSNQEGEAILTGIPNQAFAEDDSEDTEVSQLRTRFEKLHVNPMVNQIEDPFSSFHKDAGNELVNLYIENLDQFYRDIPAEQREWAVFNWHHFLQRDLSFEHLATEYFQGNKDLEDRAVRLAFLRNYPQFYDKPGLTNEVMLQAIKAQSIQDGKAILTASLKRGSRLSGRIIKKGYDSPFLRSNMIVKPILQTIDENAHQWKTPDYFAPYCALIGPSMCGKSRSLMEMARHICVIYVCLRPPEATTGYPPRSALADHMLSPRCDDEYYSLLITGIFQTVANFFNNQNAAKKKEERLKEWNDYNEVASLQDTGRANRIQEKFTKDVLDEMKKFTNSQNNHRKNIFAEAVKAMSESTKFISTGPSVRVLLALDEARALLETPGPGNEISFFRTFRRTIRNIASDMGFFAVLVDTTSHVANFSIASKFDPSARYDFVGENRLYAPIYEIASFDAMVPPESPKSWGELVSPERLFKYGSPIFGAYFRDAIADQHDLADIYDSIMLLAHQKLLGPPNFTHREETTKLPMTKAQVFAFLGPTIQPRLNGAFHLNTELIASHAAHCDYISPRCDMVMSNYPSQFTLAAAAAKHLKNDDELIQCIKALTAFVLHGLNAAGRAGELASRIILLRAMQVAMTTSCEEGLEYGRPVRLVNFLRALTGVEEVEKLDLGSIDSNQKKDLLDHGMIFWNHFSHIKYSPTSKDLLQFLYRGMATQCQPNQPGLDQIFTIYLKRDSDDLDVNNVSFCGIQVKNRQTNIDLENDHYKYTDRYACIEIMEKNPYLILYMDLNSKAGSKPDSISTLPIIYRTSRSDASPILESRTTRNDKSRTACSSSSENVKPAATRSSSSQNVKPATTGSSKVDYGRRASLVFHGLGKIACLSGDVKSALQELIHTEPDFVQLHCTESGKLYSKIVNPCLYQANNNCIHNKHH